MSELNVYHHELRHNEYAEFYLKYEADKVIAEKDKVIAYAQALVLKDIEIIRHHKYKRCLDKAEWCDSEMNYWYDRIEMEQCPRFKFFARWQKRWLELAEKFKDGK